MSKMTSNTSEQMNTTDQININFVQEVEKYPCLYDYNDDTYGSKDVVDEVWKNIGSQFGWTVGMCKDKWRNIRTVFLRHKKKPLSGFKRHRYYLSQHLEFLNQFLKPVLEKHKKNLSSSFDGAILDIKFDILDDTKNVSVDCLSAKQKYEDRSCLKPLAPSKRRSSSSSKDSVNHSELLPEKKLKGSLSTKSSETLSSSENSRILFLTSLIPEIDELSEAHFRIFKRKVLNLIDDIAKDIDPHVSQ